MSQLLAAFGIDWKLLLAQVVNFGLLLIVLTYFFYKPLMRVLEKRKEVVVQGVDDAARAAEKLAAADSVAAKRISEAEREAEHILRAAREEARAEQTQLAHDAEARARAFMSDAEARAQEIRERARRESEKEIARLAILAAEKVLRES